MNYIFHFKLITNLYFCIFFSDVPSYSKNRNGTNSSYLSSSISNSSLNNPQPTANLDRTNDSVYRFTTNVVQAVRLLLQGVQAIKVDNYIELVKNVGIQLRGLLGSVDELIPSLPLWSHREIEMTHKVLSKDMATLIQAMKNALKYSRTTIEREYRKGMLQAAHVLVINAKNLLDSVDSVRLRLNKQSANVNSPPRSSQASLQNHSHSHHSEHS